MNRDLEDYIRRLRLEDIVWAVYVSLGILNIISNSYEEVYVKCNNIEDRNMFRSINIFIFTAAIFVYGFFVIRNLKYKSNKNNDIDREKLNYLSFTASIIFLIGGIINLYVEIQGYNKDLEI